jgi:hypothetical protein
MAEKNKTITVLVSTAVILILALALITSMAEETQKRTTQTAVASESIDIAPARLTSGSINTTYPIWLNHNTTADKTWKAEQSDCNINVDRYGNSTLALTVTTDYAVNSAGRLLLVNTSNVAGSAGSGSNTTWTIAYKYCADDYLATSWGRTLLNLTPGLIAIAILVIAILASYSLLKREGED